LTDPDPALDEDGWRHDSIGRSYSFEAGNVALGKAGDRLVGERLPADQPVRLQFFYLKRDRKESEDWIDKPLNPVAVVVTIGT